QSTVSAWHRPGGSAPSWDEYHDVAAYFDVDADWLFNGEGEPPDGDLWIAWLAHSSERTKGAEPGAAKPDPRAGARRHANKVAERSAAPGSKPGPKKRANGKTRRR